MITTALTILTYLFLKHFVIDFLLQNEYQWKNKGTFMHPGGLLHSGLHGLATFSILAFWIIPEVALVIGLIEAFVHYIIDYAKMNINKHFNYQCNKDPEFWDLLGLDQTLHSLTYIAIVAWIFS